jgi:YidC/Oxa1 family membrane protein insertase
LQQSTITANYSGEPNTGAQEDLPEQKESAVSSFGAYNSTPYSVILGAQDPCTEDPETGYRYQLELSAKGAGIRKVTFSNGGGKGFDDCDYKNPQPLVLLSPLKLNDGTEIITMANSTFEFVEHKQRLALDKLNWKFLGFEEGEDGSTAAGFEAEIVNKSDGKAVIKLTKTYKIVRGSYLLECDIAVENLAEGDQEIQFNINGPIGIDREGRRSDMRNVVSAFLVDDGRIVSSRRDLVTGFPMNVFSGGVDLKSTTTKYHNAVQSGDEAQISEAYKKLQIGYNLPTKYKNRPMLWAATSNKYFTSIVRPVPQQGQQYCKWLSGGTCQFYNPDGDDKAKSGDETIGIKLASAAEQLKAGSSKSYGFQLYLGPKDKRLFDKDELYKKLGFYNVLTLMPCCCCPAAIIRPLAFGVLALMEWMYYFIPNYGVVIIILVFVVRLCLHPLTKKGQVSMSKMSKLAPKVEQIKKKYANDKAELNKQIMALYREQGASPFTGMLPMFIQMPIWIALYSSILASVSLRGQPFLPFWITDLSAPDALFRFSAVSIPLLGKVESFNLLPILMGVAFYLQQKLMPKQAAAATNPQMAQQQKIMMFMMPILFPLLLYNSPSGLNLYIMSSVFAGVVESYFIRRHIKEKEEAESAGLVSATSKTGGKVKKKKPKPFFRNM